MRQLNLQTKIGFILINTALIVPLSLSIYLIYLVTFNVRPLENPELIFFSTAGPYQLLLTAVLGLFVTNYFLISKSKLFWWVLIGTTVLVGIQDSIAMTIFYFQTSKEFLFPFAPFVTGTNFIGLFLVKKHCSEGL